jgi:hypothetical protein
MIWNRQRLPAGGDIVAGQVVKESITLNQQFSIESPSFMDNWIHEDSVEDEIKVAYFNTGYPGSVDYVSLE